MKSQDNSEQVRHELAFGARKRRRLGGTSDLTPPLFLKASSNELMLCEQSARTAAVMLHEITERIWFQAESSAKLFAGSTSMETALTANR